MINHADIENIIGCKTLVTDRMQQAIEGWYDAAINGLPLSRDPETLSLGLPAVICSELARLTTLELDAKVEGSPRADWVNTQLQRVLAPRRQRKFALALEAVQCLVLIASIFPTEHALKKTFRDDGTRREIGGTR